MENSSDSKEKIGIDEFCGTWKLVPEKSRYELGLPPKDAIYRISREGESLKFYAEWHKSGGPVHVLYFEGVLGGKEQRLTDPTIGDSITVSLNDRGALDTITRKEGRILGFARRTLSEDGRYMTLTKIGSNLERDIHNNGAASYKNISLYERIE